MIGVRTAIASADVSLQKAGTEINDGDYQGSQKQLADTAELLRVAMTELNGRGEKPKR